jgi:uncharacterized protein (DUF1778 family)
MGSLALAKQCRINIRTTKKQKDLIERGARTQGQNVTEFIISSAAEKAEQVLADQHEFVLSPAKWHAFTAALDRPPATPKRLAKLMSEAAILER